MTMPDKYQVEISKAKVGLFISLCNAISIAMQKGAIRGRVPNFNSVNQMNNAFQVGDGLMLGQPQDMTSQLAGLLQGVQPAAPPAPADTARLDKIEATLAAIQAKL